MSGKVNVIGAGLGGLAAAIRLARAGYSVTVFEKNSQAGGKMNEYKSGKFRFDTGPSLLTMPFIVDDLFYNAGFKREDYLEFVSVEPLCRYFFSDKCVFDAYDDLNKMRESLVQFAPDESENFRRYMKYCEELYNTAGGVFIYSPIHELRTIFTRRNFPLLFKLHKLDAWRSVHKSLESFFTDSRIIQLFDRYTTYNGSDPFQAPATLNIIPYVEYNTGACYIKGGMYRLVESLIRVCEKLGVQVRLNTHVKKIWHEHGRIKGIFIENERVESDYVVCNSDVVNTFEELIDGYEPQRRRLKRMEPSLSGMVFLWNIKMHFPQLAHHNIFFSENYQREFQQMFRNRTPAEDPTIYIAITCRSDVDHAPRGSENWFVLLNMPYLDERQNWPQYIKWVKERVVRKLNNYGLNIESYIDGEKVFTPESFAQMYGANKGSIYGLSSNSQFSAFMRPANRNRSIKGLYFTGGSAHPGGGIPLVLLSGKMASEIILGRQK